MADGKFQIGDGFSHIGRKNSRGDLKVNGVITSLNYDDENDIESVLVYFHDGGGADEYACIDLEWIDSAGGGYWQPIED